MSGSHFVSVFCLLGATVESFGVRSDDFPTAFYVKGDFTPCGTFYVTLSLAACSVYVPSDVHEI